MAKLLQRVLDLEKLYHSDKIIGLRFEEELTLFVPSTGETLTEAEFEQRWGSRGVVLHIIYDEPVD